MKNLNAAICCLDYLQVDLAEQGMDKAVYFLDRAIEEIARALPNTETGTPGVIVRLADHHRDGQ